MQAPLSPELAGQAPLSPELAGLVEEEGSEDGVFPDPLPVGILTFVIIRSRFVEDIFYLNTSIAWNEVLALIEGVDLY